MADPREWDVEVEHPHGGTTTYVRRSYDEACELTKQALEAGAVSVYLTPWEDALAESA